MMLIMLKNTTKDARETRGMRNELYKADSSALPIPTYLALAAPESLLVHLTLHSLSILR